MRKETSEKTVGLPLDRPLFSMSVNLRDNVNKSLCVGHRATMKVKQGENQTCRQSHSTLCFRLFLVVVGESVSHLPNVSLKQMCFY